MHCSAVQSYAVRFISAQCSAAQCSAVQSYTVSCSAVAPLPEADRDHPAGSRARAVTGWQSDVQCSVQPLDVQSTVTAAGWDNKQSGGWKSSNDLSKKIAFLGFF